MLGSPPYGGQGNDQIQQDNAQHLRQSLPQHKRSEARIPQQIGIVCLCKKDDHHATSKLLAFDPIEEIDIDKKSNLFYLLERMQDEVHNFTINYHRQIRSKGSLSSVLDNIEGIGEKRKKELLKKYRSINKMKEVSIDELDNILPHNVSINLKVFLENYK